MPFRGKLSFLAFTYSWSVLAVVLLYSLSSAAEVDVVRVQYRRAAELVPVVQSLLSPKGTVTVSERINSLVIVDTPEAIQRVHTYLERFDRPVEQVRIRVRFHTTATDNQRAAAARGRYSTDELSVSTGGKKRDGVDISVADRERRQISSSESFVVAMSGSPAFIRTGKEIPYRHGSAFFRRYAPGDGTIAWQNVESGFEGVVRFFAAQTELTVPLGQWVEIGGADDQQNEIVKEILSKNRSGENTATSMSLMVQRP
jgi:hypothetical protein